MLLAGDGFRHTGGTRRLFRFRMALVCDTPLRLTRLRFPFAVRVTALRGVACLRDANARRDVRPGDPFVVPAFAYFDCDLREPSAIAIQAVPDHHCARMAALGPEKHWSRALAQQIFREPALAWNAALVAQRWEVAPRLVRARLFAEGEALQALLREQRAAHAVYALASQPLEAERDPAAPGALAQQAGLRSAAALARACALCFGADLQALACGADTVAAEPARCGWIGWRQLAAA